MKKILITASRILREHALTLAMIIGAIVSITIAGFAKFADECERVPDEVLRLHILAESNSKEDQAFKYELRDFILANFTQELGDCDSLESARIKSEELLPLIEKSAQNFAARSDITAEITRMYFPTRVYGSGAPHNSLTLPAGNYTALRIVIGEGNGDNWWCVMFPLLCVSAVTDNTQAVDVISVPEPIKEKDTPKVKFAVFELFAGIFKK